MDEVGQRAGESLGLTYAAAIDGDVDCDYESEDSDLMVKGHCQDYESLGAAVDDIDVRRRYVPGTEPYDGVGGDEAVIQNMELSDPTLETPGYRVIIRQGGSASARPSGRPTTPATPTRTPACARCSTTSR